MVPEEIKLGIVKQSYPPSNRPDIPSVLAKEFEKVRAKIKPGDRVLITSGSRGIESMGEVLAALVKLVTTLGARPLIIPAMGSHGGGTAKGQVEVLEHLGQTEASLGAPIYRDYVPAQVGEVFGGLPVFIDSAALPENTDHVILVGRVKEHTEFSGPIESGLLKMAVVGLGRTAGATSMHQSAVKHTYSESIMSMARVIFKAAPVLGGVALVEDQRNILAHLEVVEAADIESRERELLKMSQSLKPKLPFDSLDILVVDEMGKDISGAGLDTKVIGRIMNIYEKEIESPRITRLITLRLSEKGGGNAIGVGLNDFITQELFDQIDAEMTNLNSVVAISPEKGRCPIVLKEARSALAAALETIGPCSPQSMELAWIINTKDLEYLAVSEVLWKKAESLAGLELVSAPQSIPFDGQGRLPKFDDWLHNKVEAIKA